MQGTIIRRLISHSDAGRRPSWGRNPTKLCRITNIYLSSMFLSLEILTVLCTIC